MKKELIAAVLLAVIFAGVMLNIRASERIVSSLMSEVDAAYAQLQSGDNESAVKTIDRAMESKTVCLPSMTACSAASIALI